SMASRPCHSRFGSPISAGVNTAAVISQIKATQVSQKAGFGRPDKAQPPSGKGAAVIMPDGAHAYPAYAVSVRSCQRHHKKTAIRRNARWRF
ncbi:hypothetical protein, partial [Kosakonia cowanii]|uniref:hypothetical protein n=1 Tax=Kosakonia cowanii TaxID=208223 RepID=UPI003075F368